jgi:hypothetical protein
MDGMTLTNDDINITGKLTIIEKDLSGNIIDITEYTNLVTNKFKVGMANVLSGDYSATAHVIGYLAVGTSDTAANEADTALGAQVGANKAYVVGSLHNDTTATKAEATFFFDSDESTYYETWKEVGLYAANGTDLLTHTVLDPTKTFNVTKTMTVNYVIEIT